MHPMKMTTLAAILIWLIVVPTAHAAADPEIDMDAFNQCLLEKIKTAGPETTAQEIREACLLEVRGQTAQPPVTGDAADPDLAKMSPLDERFEGIKATQELDYVITPYKPNYLMVGYNPDPNTAPFQEAFPGENIDFKAAEVKFQISFMFPVVHNIFKDNGSLYVAYTNRSFWQLFDDDLSSPFRETNHEPEIWLQFTSNKRQRHRAGVATIVNQLGGNQFTKVNWFLLCLR